VVIVHLQLKCFQQCHALAAFDTVDTESHIFSLTPIHLHHKLHVQTPILLWLRIDAHTLLELV
jgi:hypothetical protein